PRRWSCLFALQTPSQQAGWGVCLAEHGGRSVQAGSPPSDYLWIKEIKPSRGAPSPLARRCREIAVSERRRPSGGPDGGRDGPIVPRRPLPANGPAGLWSDSHGRAVDAEREAERAGGRRSARPLRHRHPDVRSGLGLGPFHPPGEATPARREEGARRKRCIETFRANFVASARSRERERARRGCLPAPAPGERPRTGAAVELGLPGGGGRAAAGRPRSLRSALRSAHRERQRGPAESRPYGRVNADSPKRRPPAHGAPRGAREAAGAEEERARARQRGGGGGGLSACRSAAGPAPRRAPATMNFLLTWIHWGLAALLYLQSAELSKAAPALGDGERKPNEVIKFLEVYERSFCRTIETLVDIFQEYPDEVEYIFRPSCVPLMRCAGCCGDEGLECVPVDVYNVTMEIARIKPHQSQHIAHMSFLQHSKCDCRPKKDVKNKQEKWAQKPRSDGPSYIPQTWSLHDPQPWQSFLMLYPESGKSRRVCPTRMDSSCRNDHKTWNSMDKK
uniref:Vascular endothelial growth factor A n=1 Tax=Coturnix japonica TaxID=93934 RepID=A0A8C2TLF7_COTJA